jgi:methylmalonyl-CoA mutase
MAESDRDQWRAAVAGVLAKSRRKDPTDLGAEPEHLLDSETYEGFPIRPLYTILDSQPEPPLPGRWPFVRGGDARRDVKSGWKVVETFPLPGRAKRRGMTPAACLRRNWTASSRASSSNWCP